MSEPVVLINVFEVPAADAEYFTAEWEKARDYLETQPGYVDTALHQALAPDAGFQFVNVAHWATVEEFTTAIRSPGFQQASAGMAATARIPPCTGSSAPERRCVLGLALGLRSYRYECLHVAVTSVIGGISGAKVSWGPGSEQVKTAPPGHGSFPTRSHA